MKLRLFVLVILFASVSLLFIPNLINMPITGQTDKSFKGTGAPFIPPSLSERLGLTSGNNFEFEDGDGEDDGWPVPTLAFMSTVRGLPAALSVILNVAVRSPVPLALNRKVIVQFRSGAIA